MSMSVDLLITLTTSPQFALLSLPVSNNVSEGKVVQFLTNIVTAVCFSAHVQVANIGRSLTLESGDVMIQFASPDVTSIQKDFHHHEGFSQNAAKELSGFQHHEGFSQNATKGFSGFHYHEGFSQS